MSDDVLRNGSMDEARVPVTRWSVVSGCVNGLASGFGIVVCLYAIACFMMLGPAQIHGQTMHAWVALNLLMGVLLGVVVLADMIVWDREMEIGPYTFVLAIVVAVVSVALPELIMLLVTVVVPEFDWNSFKPPAVFTLDRRVYWAGLAYGLLRWSGHAFKRTEAGTGLHPMLRRKSWAKLMTRKHLFAAAHRVAKSTAVISVVLMWMIGTFISGRDFEGKYVVYFYCLAILCFVSVIVLFRGLVMSVTGDSDATTTI